jgi:hypothetical protein
MTTQIYVLAQQGKRHDLAIGNFEKSKIGEKFARHPVNGNEPWEIIKIFSHEEQRDLEAIERLVGFERLSQLFRI